MCPCMWYVSIRMQRGTKYGSIHTCTHTCAFIMKLYVHSFHKNLFRSLFFYLFVKYMSCSLYVNVAVILNQKDINFLLYLHCFAGQYMWNICECYLLKGKVFHSFMVLFRPGWTPFDYINLNYTVSLVFFFF